MTIYHKHHIIPKHRGGTDDESNLILVTLEEHANLHKQLWEDLGDIKDYIAWLGLSGQLEKEDIISIIQRLPKSEEHKNSLSKSVSILYQQTKNDRKWGRPKGSKNKRPYSQEILDARSGKNHPMFGKTGSDNPNYGKSGPGSRPDLSERNRLNPPAKGKPKSEEWKQKNRKPKSYIKRKMLDDDAD